MATTPTSIKCYWHYSSLNSWAQYRLQGTSLWADSSVRFSFISTLKTQIVLILAWSLFTSTLWTHFPQSLFFPLCWWLLTLDSQQVTPGWFVCSVVTVVPPTPGCSVKWQRERRRCQWMPGRWWRIPGWQCQRRAWAAMPEVSAEWRRCCLAGCWTPSLASSFSWFCWIDC